jgi:hypothetical protein
MAIYNRGDVHSSRAWGLDLARSSESSMGTLCPRWKYRSALKVWWSSARGQAHNRDANVGALGRLLAGEEIR